MYFKSLAALSLSALAGTVSAVGNAKVHNACPDPVYLWSVGSSVSGVHTIESGATFSEQFHRDPQTGGIALKITRTADGLYDGSPQLTFSYTLDPSQLWYDLSTIFGEGFSGEVLSVASDGCPGICWPDGTQPAGSQVKTCGTDKDQTLTLCAENCPA
ncbi:putative BYS1 domain protein [Aspergillus undulatus]|uniref:putative BYS1 domain protein n=1 Tax=Aspergillus undulatus TaxID=1810928 RepID=UPI003CCCDACF